MAAFFTAFLAILSFIFSSVSVVSESILALVDLKNHITATATIAAIRPAIGYIQLTSEAYMSVAAFTGADNDPCSICKHITPLFQKKAPNRIDLKPFTYFITLRLQER